jgi:beta-lactamase class A
MSLIAHRFLSRIGMIAAAVMALCIPIPASPAPSPQEDSTLDQQIKSIADAHHGHVALFAQDLRSGKTASLSPDEPVQTASVIKMGILLDSAEQIRAGKASFDERLVLTKENQVEGSGVLGVLTPPIALTLRDTLTLMVVLSDNTATNMAIDRLGLAHINETLRDCDLPHCSGRLCRETRGRPDLRSDSAHAAQPAGSRQPAALPGDAGYQ